MVGGTDIVKNSSDDVWTTNGYATHHASLFVVVDNSRPTQYSYAYGNYHSIFLTEVESASIHNTQASLDSYALYVSQGISIYLVRLPVPGTTS